MRFYFIFVLLKCATKTFKKVKTLTFFFTLIVIASGLNAQQDGAPYSDSTFDNPYGLTGERLSGTDHLPHTSGGQQTAGLNSDPLHEGILVSDGNHGDNSIRRGNTSRNVAAGPEGNIYAVYYHHTNGIRVARSTNGGQSFHPSVQVKDSYNEAEIAVSQNGNVYVAWVEINTAYVSRSLDGGTSFQTPVNAGSASTGVHMATKDNHVFLVDQPGNNVLSSNDNGQNFSQLNLAANQVYADIHVDRQTGEVIVFADNPAVKYYISNDNGASFGAQIDPVPGGEVYFSIAAYSSGTHGRYAFIAGFPFFSQNDYLLKINVADNTSSQITAGPIDTNQGRSLAADKHGNVVDAYVASGDKVHFRFSNDLAETFSSEVVVADGNSASVGINETNGDILYLYSHNGEIYLSVYDGLLTGYEAAAVPVSGLSFAILSLLILGFGVLRFFRK